MVPVTAVTARLRDDPAFAALATGGTFDHDIRRTGAAFLTGDYGDILPSAMVDDAGGGRDSFGAGGAFSDRVMIWAFAPDNRAGREAVRAIMVRAIMLLHGWQDPVSRVQVFSGDRLGLQATDAPDASTFDRLTFKCAGVNAGVTT